MRLKCETRLEEMKARESRRFLRIGICCEDDRRWNAIVEVIVINQYSIFCGK